MCRKLRFLNEASALLSLQLVLFGLSNQMVVAFKEENTITFKHLFLKDYADGSEGTYAIYSQADVYDHMFYAVDKVGIVGQRRCVGVRVAESCEGATGTNGWR